MAESAGGGVFNRRTGRRIAAVMPMHVFGLPLLIEEIAEICAEWGIPLVEDGAESLGSRVGDRHTGRAGLVGAFSFNGNKTITCGGGGCIVTDDPELGRRAKHLTTTAKRPHKWDFYHDEVAWNYRMPNLNAALACAQLEQLDAFLADKRETALYYAEAMRRLNVPFVDRAAGHARQLLAEHDHARRPRERDRFPGAVQRAGGDDAPRLGADAQAARLRRRFPRPAAQCRISGGPAGQHPEQRGEAVTLRGAARLAHPGRTAKRRGLLAATTQPSR
jgi:dTDP-4-amino-4,6-dideoxygalactose transaminase